MSSPPIRWQWKRFAELQPDELYTLLAARAEVFVLEQACAFVDLDGLDRFAWHLLGWVEREGVRSLAAYLRLIEPGRKYAEPSIGRVLTIAAFRHTGLGRAAMHEGLTRSAALYPGRAVRIGAQQRLEKFYEQIGFRTVSAPYEEDGIAHVEMLRRSDSG
ncbi:MAG TPA: GNAT family N-acetyltransferase [Casimicrobiaceae bacterium]|nr:GNAT family N-acetyltransferase [Casimicrobiaceae bacterium]